MRRGSYLISSEFFLTSLIVIVYTLCTCMASSCNFSVVEPSMADTHLMLNFLDTTLLQLQLML